MAGFFGKIVTTALGITAYEMVLRPLVVRDQRKAPAADDDEDGFDEVLDEDWNDAGD